MFKGLDVTRSYEVTAKLGGAKKEIEQVLKQKVTRKSARSKK
jgi:hypothetical protein